MMEPAELKAQFDAWMILEREKLEAKDTAALSLTRKMRIDQVKSKIKDPANKRAIGHLTELQFDAEEFQSNFLKLVSPDKTIVDVKENADEVEKFLNFCLTFGNMMLRKLSREIECYEIANRSPHGWAAVKYFEEEGLFDNKEATAWYEKEELEKDEKVKKLRNAERQAAIAMKNKKQFVRKADQGQRGRKRSRWGPDFSAPAAAGAPAPTDGRFGQQQLWYPPQSRGAGGLRCYACDEVGHLRRNCPKLKH